MNRDEIVLAKLDELKRYLENDKVSVTGIQLQRKLREQTSQTETTLQVENFQLELSEFVEKEIVFIIHVVEST